VNSFCSETWRMHNGANRPSDESASQEVLARARRDRWATPLACVATLLHMFASSIVFVWLYFIAPRYKKQLDDLFVLGQVGRLSPSALMQINVSDFFVNYWYVFAVLFIPIPIITFLAHHWLTRQLGLRWAGVSAVLVTLLIISNAVVGYWILGQAFA
jgi:hypothetical protein